MVIMLRIRANQLYHCMAFSILHGALILIAIECAIIFRV